ncbi:hypothetical protein Tco_0673523 [Tanacetum coccineum]
MGDENPIRTLGDYSKPSHAGYRNTIELPVGNNVVPLRSDTIRLVQNECSFYGLRAEDPNQHLKDFLKLVDLLDLDGANREEQRMRIDRWLQIQIFYDHVSFHLKCEIDRAAGGKLRDKNADESWEIIENLALYDHEGWNDSKNFVKPIKAVSIPQSTSKTPDRRLLELEDHINFLLKGSQPTPRPSSTHESIKERERSSSGTAPSSQNLFNDLPCQEWVENERIPESLCKIKKGIKNDIEPIAPTITVNRLVLEWEEKIKLHQEKKMKFDQWRSKNFKNKRPALVKVEDEGEVTLYLMRRSLEVLRKFHWMILEGRFNQLSHVSSLLLSKPGKYRMQSYVYIPSYGMCTYGLCRLFWNIGIGLKRRHHLHNPQPPPHHNHHHHPVFIITTTRTTVPSHHNHPHHHQPPQRCVGLSWHHKKGALGLMAAPRGCGLPQKWETIRGAFGFREDNKGFRLVGLAEICACGLAKQHRVWVRVGVSKLVFFFLSYAGLINLGFLRLLGVDCDGVDRAMDVGKALRCARYLVGDGLQHSVNFVGHLTLLSFEISFKLGQPGVLRCHEVRY